jgi:ribosomal protein L16/L10AE
MQPNAPILPGGQTMTDPAMVTDTLLRAAQQAATKSLTAQGQDCKDFATAALNFAQAVIVLDPQMSQGGTPLEHDLALKGMEGETQARVAAIQGETAVAVEHVRGEHSLRQARETAAAPTPRKKVTVNRENGRMTGMDVEG